MFFCSVQPSITNLTYDRENYALTCVYTGSPTVNIFWEKDGVPLSIDDPSYQLTQTVTDIATSTYSSVLMIKETAQTCIAGRYSCRISNQIGSDSKDLTVTGRY